MPDFLQALTEMRQQMNAELTRSDVLRALIWPNAGLLLSVSGAAAAGSPNWLMICLVAMLAIFMLLYAAAYVFFAITDPDALRSEKYKLQKIAIEKGLLGDSLVGLNTDREIEVTPVPMIPVTPSMGDEND